MIPAYQIALSSGTEIARDIYSSIPSMRPGYFACLATIYSLTARHILLSRREDIQHRRVLNETGPGH